MNNSKIKYPQLLEDKYILNEISLNLTELMDLLIDLEYYIMYTDDHINISKRLELHEGTLENHDMVFKVIELHIRSILSTIPSLSKIIQLRRGNTRKREVLKISIANIKIISKLVILMFTVDGKELFRTIGIINKIRKCNGILYMYRYMKFVRLHITRYICGRPLRSIPNSGVSTINSGPKHFTFLKPLLSNDNNLRYLLSILTVTKGIKPVKKEGDLIKPSFESITKEYTGQQYVIPKFFINVMIRKYQIKGELEVPSSKTLFLNMKSSPTGISIQTAFSAALLHPTRVHEYFKTLLLEAYDKIFLKAVEFGYSHEEFHPKGIEPGKIGIVHDSEGKERVIAMSDYWSQWALKPIHDHCLSILKQIPMDRTFSQDPFHDWKDDGEKFHSLDLTSATDRFPLFVQHKVLKQFYGDDIADAWAGMLVDRNYSYQGFNYRYAVGQPMGCYSSGAVFALTHHFVVQWAAYLSGYKDFRDYILLGDDIVIKNNKVALRYTQLMRKGGVEISPHKTHISRHTYEFAKRWIHKGVDISPMPMKGILTHVSEPKSILLILLDGFIKVKFEGEYNSIYSIVKESYKRTRFKSQGYTEELLSKLLYDFWIGLSYIKRLINSEDLRSYGVEKGYKEDDLPFGDDIFVFTQRITNFSLGRLISNTITNLSTYSEKFMKDFFMNKFKTSDYPSHPMCHAIGNTLKGIEDRLKAFDEKNSDASLIVDAIVVPGINEIVHLKRKIRKEVIGIDRLGKESIRPDLMLHFNDMFFLDMDTIWKAKSLTAIYNAGNRFEVIRSGKYDAGLESRKSKGLR